MDYNNMCDTLLTTEHFVKNTYIGPRNTDKFIKIWFTITNKPTHIKNTFLKSQIVEERLTAVL